MAREDRLANLPSNSDRDILISGNHNPLVAPSGWNLTLGARV
jgi:hypothetical protein